ncbi:hypothetical protein PVAND_001351 [Polypedilum vanderplanki]|uniref:ABC-type glutathione-S-conjugate transporter n=1 Tax=Polypedilum vanderplanki TaxID=319348 RepID=A0A9J6BMY5_POLVA|nr:hypothetical protein PVAND_001351 [Polypedilum vanderplanki]
MNAEFCGSEFWDSDLSWRPENPDFTFCFKNSVLIWVPCAFLFIFSPLDFYRHYNSRYSNIPASFLNITKFCIMGFLILLTIADLTMMVLLRANKHEETIFGVQFVSTGLKILTFILAVILQQFHLKKGHRSSIFLFIFWLVLTICAIPQLRWEVREFNVDFNNTARLWASYHCISFIIFFSCASIMTVLCAFSDKEPRVSTYPKYANPSPELSVGSLNQLLYQWFTSTAWKGFKNPLTEEDIYDINPQFATSELTPKFDKYFQESIERNKKKSKPLASKQTTEEEDEEFSEQATNGSVMGALWHAFGGKMIFSLFLRIITDLLQFAQPFLLGTLIDYIATDGALWKGLFLTFTFFSISLISAILNNYQMMLAFHVGFKVRTSLISAVYRKALKISSSVKKNATIGQIVNLMAVDAHRFYDTSPYILYGLTAPMIMALALYFLWEVIGVSAFAGLAVLIIIFPISGVVANEMQKVQHKQMSIKDERVKKISEILGGIKVIKFYAWEQSFQEQISETRNQELKYLRKNAMLNASTEFLWTLAPFFVSFATFTTYVMLGNVLRADVAFVAIVLFNILRLPITMLPMTINSIMMAIVSAKRITKFMNSKEIDPNNVSHNPSEFAIEFNNATFSWDGNEKILKNINLKVPKGSLTAVVGQVASGKSSLISALLGDMEKLEGTVNVDGSIAYVPQMAWIQNATLQDNILFGKPLNKDFYQKVIHACALTADLAMLPGGDQTEIGEKGINLSGGQKQRVSLARAVYSQAQIYIFDDPLSAVDSHVGKHIFDNVLSENGMLQGKTRLLVTHAISYLPKVDEILVMTNGEISESGSYKILLAQKGAFSEFLIQYLQEHPDDEDINELDVENEDIRLMLKRSISEVSRQSGSRSSYKRHDSVNSGTHKDVEEKKNEEKEEDVDKLIEAENAAVGNVSTDVYLRYFKSVGLKLIIAILLFVFCSETSSVLSNFWIVRWTIDTRTESEDANFWRNFYVGIYGALGTLLSLTYFAAAMTFAYGAVRAARNLHSRLFYNVLRLPMSFFDTTPLGRIVNRFSRDTDMIDAYLPFMMFSWTGMLFSCIGTIIVISYSTPWFLIVVVPLVAGYYFIQRFYIKTSRQLKRIESITRSPVYSHFGESVSGQSVIRAYKEENRFKVESETRVDHNQSIAYQTIIADLWLGVRLEIVGAFIVLFACLFAILARYDIEEATVGLSISYALQISAVLSYFVFIATEVESNIVSIERVEEYADLPQEAAWKTNEIDTEWPQQGIIEFKDFQVRYREGLDLVLKGLNFKCNSSEKIGIVGRTGAGKSSMTLSLFRIIEAASGKIIIDGIDISEIGLHSLRSRLTIIPQDSILFSGTLRMNIDPFNSFSDDAVWMALEHSHLKAFVKSLPDGLSYIVSEGGENLSVGQRQLVCLARALLRKTRVLILDEATAAIDIETDELIQKTIRMQFNDCTILTIAHRLNTIMDSDRIIVLDKGEIAEFDSPDALLSNRNSIFYGMARDAGLVNDELTQMN